MLKKYFFIFILFSLIFFVVTPFVSASNLGDNDSGSSSGGALLPNPLGEGRTDIREIIGFVIRAILGIVGSLALLVFVYGGFTWVISGGNEEKVRKGKDMIFWAALGIAVIFLSYAMVTFVLNAVSGA